MKTPSDDGSLCGRLLLLLQKQQRVCSAWLSANVATGYIRRSSEHQELCCPLLAAAALSALWLYEVGSPEAEPLGYISQ